MKKIYKRIFSLGAAALAVTPMISVVACGNSGDSAKDTTKDDDIVSKTLTAENYKDQITFKDGTLTIRKEVTSIEPKALDAFYKENKPTTLTILGPVNKIEANIFTGWNSLATINLDNELKTIDANAFENAVLTSLTIPNSVTSIGDAAFKNSKLTSLAISDSVTSVGDSAFENSPLTTLTFSDKSSLKTIGASAFTSAKLTTLTIPENVISVGDAAFKNSNLTSLTLPESLQIIGTVAFQGAVLTTLAIPSNVITIGNSSFGNSPLTTLTFSDKSSLKTIGTYAFQSAKLTSLVIPNGVIEIGQTAFTSSPLTSLTIPASLTHIQSGGEGSIALWVFWGIKNDASTKVTMPKVFNTNEDKDNLFNENNWDQIVFDYT